MLLKRVSGLGAAESLRISIFGSCVIGYAYFFIAFLYNSCNFQYLILGQTTLLLSPLISEHNQVKISAVISHPPPSPPKEKMEEKRKLVHCNIQFNGMSLARLCCAGIYQMHLAEYPFGFLFCSASGHTLIIESTDSICRDSADMQYMLIQRNSSKSPKQLT